MMPTRVAISCRNREIAAGFGDALARVLADRIRREAPAQMDWYLTLDP
jgi:hypothetical protein